MAKRYPARARRRRVARSSSRSGVAGPARPNRVLVIGCAALLAVTLLAYFPAIGGDFVWDDDDHVANNAALRSVEGLRLIWVAPSATPQYYPLVHTSFWLEYRAWGLSPTGYHVTNILLHVISTVLLLRILQKLSVPGSWLIAAIFAIHPVHVESVAWISERKNVLSGAFYLAALLTFLKFGLETPEHERDKRIRLYVVALLLFVCALLSKTVTASLPAALLVLIAWKRQRVDSRDIWPLVPFFIVGVAMALLTVWLERHHVGARGIDWQLSVAERCLIAGRALWFYAHQVVWPTRLAFSYPRWELDVTDPIQIAYPLGAITIVVALWLARRRIGSGPLVAVLLFAGTLVPALGFFDVFPMRYSFVADHFQYLASIGLIALVAGGAVVLVDRWSPMRGRAAIALAAILIPLLAVLTWRQAHVFKDHETLWRDTVQKYPTSWMAHTSLGALLGRRGALSEAETHYREAVRLNPRFSTAHTNLGALLANQGRLAAAIPHMREAVQLEARELEPYLNLGRALVLTGQFEEAVVWLRRAAASWPEDPRANALIQEALRMQKERPQGGS